MTRQTLDELALAGPSRPRRRPARRPVLRPRRGALPAHRPRPPGSSPRTSACTTDDDRWATGRATRCSQEIADERAHLARARGARSGRPVGDRPVRARARASTTSAASSSTPRCIRVWERRSTAIDAVGDALFRVFARDFAPLAERLDVADRPARGDPGASSTSTAAGRSCPRSASGRSSSSRPASELPSLFDEIVGRRRGRPRRAPRRRRLERAVETAEAAVADYAEWVASTLGAAVDDWALGRERYDELVGLRAFDGLDADAILEIGYEQLAENKAARVERRPRDRPDRATRRRSSTGSSRTTRRPSRRRWTPTATSWSGRAHTSSSTTS